VLDRGDDPVAVLSLTDGQARRLSAILNCAYFQPAVVTEIEAVIGELLIDWVAVELYSPGVGRTIAELEIRKRTRMTVAAILRGGEPLVSPEPAPEYIGICEAFTGVQLVDLWIRL
jgi:TrkA domain protein